MDLLWQLLVFLRRILVFAVLIAIALSLYNYHSLALVDILQCLRMAVRISFILNFVYSVILYPYWLSPLNAFPSISLLRSQELLPITENVRGRLALDLVKRFPNADAVLIRTFPGIMTVLPISAQAHRDVLSTHASDYMKPEAGVASLKRSLGIGLILAEGETHTRHRKALTRTFRIQNIQKLHPLFSSKTNIMLQEIEKEMVAKGHVEITMWASRLTMDIIGSTLMSQEFDTLKSHAHPLERAYAELVAPGKGQQLMFQLGFFTPQWLLRLIPTRHNAMAIRNSALIRKICTKMVEEKLRELSKKTTPEEDESTTDVLGSLLVEGQLSQPEIIAEMMTFLAAGHETTAASIAWAVHLLTLPQNLQFQEQLRGELKRAIADSTDGAQLSFNTLRALPLLNAVCEETLRLYPPVTSTGRIAKADTVIAGRPVARGTFVAIFPWATNRSPLFWGEAAEEMDLNRWIKHDADGSMKLDKSGGAPSNMCNQTFLHGERSCIGQDFARAELRCALAAIFADYEVRRLAGDNGNVVPVGALTIKPRSGLRVSITPISH